MDGAYPHPDPPANPYAGQPLPYPYQLPPPLPYAAPRRNMPLLVLAIVAAGLAVVAIIGGAGFVVYTKADRGMSAATATSTIQGYLNALINQDKQTVARHALCGLYDGIKDHSTDLTVANLASDAFRRQYSAAEVTSIDKIVMLSPDQAQVLFTMKATPAGPSLRGTRQSDTDVQAVAQLLVRGGKSLVCSYLPRPGVSE